MTPLTILLIAWTAAIVVGLLRSTSLAPRVVAADGIAARLPTTAAPKRAREAELIPTSAAPKAA